MGSLLYWARACIGLKILKSQQQCQGLLIAGFVLLLQGMIGLLIGFLITQTNNYYNASEIFADIASIDWDDESISSQEKVCGGTSVTANHRSSQMALPRKASCTLRDQ